MFIPRQLQTKNPKSQQRDFTPITASTKRSSRDDQTDPTLAKELVMALEMLFSDYGIGNSPPGWFSERARSMEGESDCRLLPARAGSSLLTIEISYPSVCVLGFPITRADQAKAITS